MFWSAAMDAPCLSNPYRRCRGLRRCAIANLTHFFSFIRLVWADGGYNSERVTTATNVRVEIVNKIANQVGVVVLPRRWVVERLFAWIN
jgi:hypothetical protein